jgi:hypothetical protein
VAVQLELVLTLHASVEFDIDPGVPTRSVTVIVADCCEYTLSFDAVQPAGTHASTPVVMAVLFSAVLALARFTE